MRGTRLLVTLLAVCTGYAVLAGCGGEATPDPAEKAAAAWFPPCPGPAGGGASPEPEPELDPRSSGPAVSMPSLPLPCIHGGDRVDLAAGQGVPTVVTIWASWCAPCREELPEFRRYAERVGSQVRVYGVVSADTRAAATALAQELGVRFPTLYDQAGLLMDRLGRTALPVTLFLDPEGDLTHLYNDVPLNGAELDRLTETHLGVAVDT